jgi:phosphatidylglycerol:prolipoprotein diacylglycerol transferase
MNPLPPLAYWVHNLSPFIVRFSENFGIRYYGLAYLLGFVGAVGLLFLYYKRGRSPFGGNTISDMITYLVAGVIVGGRLGYFLLYQPSVLLRDPLALLRVWEGGMASHGGFVGVMFALLWWCNRRQVPFFHISDLVVTTAPVGLFFGRIANFINGELWGRSSDVPWAVIFPLSDPRHPVNLIVPRHPSQLYEAGLEGLLLFGLMQWRFWKTAAARTQPGRITGEFLIAYAAVRAFGELFREPDAGLILGLSRGTFYSIFLVAAGLVLIVGASRKIV